MNYIQCVKCGKTIQSYELHICPIADDAVLGEEVDTEKCLLCKNLSAENICRVLRRKKSNCDWFEEATLEYGEY